MMVRVMIMMTISAIEYVMKSQETSETVLLQIHG
jgi:hypothetical protein